MDQGHSRYRQSAAAYLLLAALLSGCTYTVAGSNGPLAQCHDGALTSFCVVNVPKGAVVEGGMGLVPALGGSAIGSGAMMKAGGL